MGTMLDTSGDPRATFSGLPFDAIAAYVNGSYDNYQAARAAFPGRPVLAIDVLGQGVGDTGDFEPHAMNPAEAGTWAKKRMSAGIHRPVVYFSVGNWPIISASLGRAGVSRSEVRIWTSHYGHGKHLCTAHCGFGFTGTADATQWSDPTYLPPPYAGRHLDISLTAPDFFQSAPANHASHGHGKRRRGHGERPGPQRRHQRGPAPAWHRVLSKGHHGADVREWQEQMRKRGFVHLKADGVYGARSAGACRWLQSYLATMDPAHHWHPTGNVDQALWRATWSAP